MLKFPKLTDVINQLIDLAAAGSQEDVAFVLAALVEDMRERCALDELEWLLISLRDTNLESTSCLVLAALIFTRDFPSMKRKALCDWYMNWIVANRTEAGALVIAHLVLGDTANEYHPTSASCGAVSSIEDD